MFSGIVEAVGVIEKIEEKGGGTRLKIVSPQIVSDAQMGESIAVSGTCLTVVAYDKRSFDVEVTQETLRCTTLGNLKPESKVNLEKALKLSDRLGGHMVTGHVDTVGRVLKIEEEGFSKLITFGMEGKWSSYFVKKGSVTVEGVSLTVTDCSLAGKNSDQFWFTVALIPHTMDVTTLGVLKVGDQVNIETDVIARYVVRLLGDGYLENLNKERESIN